jgi:hypothetical protein
MDAYSSEYWAPIATSDNSADWVQIGTMDDVSTCQTYSGKYGKSAPWESDGSQTGKKQHILCCQKDMMIDDPSSSEQVSVQDVMAQALKPIWYGSSHGWNGGSHNDAQLFCSASGKKELCPFIAVSLHSFDSVFKLIIVYTITYTQRHWYQSADLP